MGILPTSPVRAYVNPPAPAPATPLQSASVILRSLMLSAWNFLRTVFCIPAFALPDAVIALVSERCLLEPVRWFCCRFNYLRCLGLDATNLRRDLTLRSASRQPGTR